jgi:hypothetical protein
MELDFEADLNFGGKQADLDHFDLSSEDEKEDGDIEIETLLNKKVIAEDV